ncbi:MAG: hypothetical protein M1840_009127 [Geoglossum simile]|nr:MAG: hypothetical protein M1840_009127 [Geoglossum simile]
MAAGRARTQHSGGENLRLEESIDNRVLDFAELIETKYLGQFVRATIRFRDKRTVPDPRRDHRGCLGDPFGNLVADKDVHGYIKAVEQMLPVALWLTIFPGSVDLMAVSWIGKRVLPSSGSYVGLGKAMGVAGAKTTATAIRTAFLYIITQPKAYATLQSETDDAIHENRISNPIRDSEAHVPPGGDVPDGKFVPGGTSIGVYARGIQRSKSLFGDDADMFRPERWIEASGEPLQWVDKMVDLVFGHRRYQCLGRASP